MNWILLLIVAAVLLGVFALNRASLIPVQRAQQLLHQGALVVDVRSPAEFNSGHLQEAVNLPLAELKEVVSRRAPDKSQVLLLHCLSGTRSGMAMRQLKGIGYSNVFNLGSYGRAERIVSGLSKQVTLQRFTRP